MRPLRSERASGDVGFTSADIESIVAGSGIRDTAYPGAALPYTDTEFCGLPRKGIVSLDDSHGSILGCSLKSVNQEQAPTAVAAARAAYRRARRTSLPLIPHL